MTSNELIFTDKWHTLPKADADQVEELFTLIYTKTDWANQQTFDVEKSINEEGRLVVYSDVKPLTILNPNNSGCLWIIMEENGKYIPCHTNFRDLMHNDMDYFYRLVKDKYDIIFRNDENEIKFENLGFIGWFIENCDDYAMYFVKEE